MVSRAVRLAAIAAAMWGAGSQGAAAWCVRGVQAWDTLRIRAAPSPAARQVGTISFNACGVSIVGGCRGMWCPVSWRGQTGWSNTAYLGRGSAADLITPSPWATPPMISMRPGPGVRPHRERAGPGGQRVARATPPRRPPQETRNPVPSRIAAAPRPPAPPPAPVRPPPATSEPPPPPPARILAPAPPPAPSAPPPAAKAPPPTNAPEPAPASAGAAVVVPPPAQAAGEMCIVNVAKGDTLKVRAGPGPDQTLRFGFPAGACGVKLTGPCKDGWCPVEYRNYRGWAEQKFLK